MKKAIVSLVFLGFLFSVPVYLVSTETVGSLNFGASVGGFPLYEGGTAFRFGGEIGYRLSSRLGVIAEIATIKSTQTYDYSSIFATAHSKTKRSSTPITLSVLYYALAGGDASAYIGLGAGYYLMKYSSQMKSQSPSYSTNYEDEWSVIAFAPHVCFGVEAKISGRIRIFGEARHVIGMVLNDHTDPAGTTIKDDMAFGGPEAKCGIRFLF